MIIFLAITFFVLLALPFLPTKGEFSRRRHLGRLERRRRELEGEE